MTAGMVRSRQFLHLPTAVPTARHFVESLIESTPTAFRQDVAVMVSELVSNCIRHTASTFEVRVELTSDKIRVEVSDHGTGTPRVGRPPPSQPTGRGLQIVELLADEWGVREAADTGRGKTVWFVKALAATDDEGRPGAHGAGSASTSLPLT
jgi:anti-sigma regulatory factor (Ser/Thr protein kinase)